MNEAEVAEAMLDLMLTTADQPVQRSATLSVATALNLGA